MLTYTISLPPPYISFTLTPFTQRNIWLQAPRHALSHSPESLPPSVRLSVGVEGSGEDDVSTDGQGGLLHLAPQDGVSYDAGGLPHLLQHLVQTLDAAHHRALLDVCQLGDFCERLVTGQQE